MKLSYTYRRTGNYLDIQFNHYPSKTVIAKLKSLGFRYVYKVRSYRGTGNYAEALKVADQAVKNSEKYKGHLPKTLCEYCRHSEDGNVSICPWAARFEPVPDWVAIPTTLYSNYKVNGRTVRREIKSYCVLACPIYQPDPPRKKVL